MSECVYILLPVHNRKEITRKFIDSLKAQTFRNYHLLLIDDGSTDGTEEMVRGLVEPEKLKIIKGKGDWWWAGSLQQGLEWLKKHDLQPSDVLLMINDDVTFRPDFLEKGVDFLKRFPESLLLARFYDEEQGKVIETGVKADFRHLSFVVADAPEDINCLSTRGLFMRWDVCERIGGFYPRLLPHYCSDYEFTIRAGRKGFALSTNRYIYIVPDLAATGIRKDEELVSIRMLFSKKCVMNPVYWTSFILLSSPVRWMPVNIARIWVGAYRAIIKKGMAA